MNIVLIGFMGAGKTTIGQSLANKLKMSHLDLDTALIEKIGRSIPDYFEKYGEAADDILLGPQVKYMYEETVEQFGSQGIPIAVIDQGDYGMMNGEKVLKSAIRLIKANK